jgi:membrane protein required for colicin V production
MALDILFCLLIFWACFKGYNKGLFVAAFSFAGIIIGLVVAFKISATVTEWLSQYTHIETSWMPLVSFFVIIIAILLLSKILAGILQKGMEFMLIGWINRLGGVLFYVLVYTVLLSIFLFFAEKLQLFKAHTLAESKCYPFIKPIGTMIIHNAGKIVPAINNMF